MLHVKSLSQQTLHFTSSLRVYYNEKHLIKHLLAGIFDRSYNAWYDLRKIVYKQLSPSCCTTNLCTVSVCDHIYIYVKIIFICWSDLAVTRSIIFTTPAKLNVTDFNIMIILKEVTTLCTLPWTASCWASWKFQVWKCTLLQIISRRLMTLKLKS